MKIQTRTFLFGLSSAILLPSLCLVAGCGSNDTIKEDPTKVQQRTDAAIQERTYFDKSHGNYDALSAEDKAALLKLGIDEKKAKEAFGHMVPTGGH